MKTLITLLLLASFSSAQAANLQPANPNANASAKAVLTFFQGLGAKKEKRLVSGQFVNFGRPANLKLMEDIHERTGQWPAFVGVDYADFSKGSLTWEAPNKVAIDYWKQGGLVSVSAHMYNPANPNGGGLRDKGVDLKSLIEPATDTHTRWMQQLDMLATALQELEDAGVVVMWRPFHEMNGDWFWWGAKDPNEFIAVWRHMFNYFTTTKKLDNLIWVYGPNHGTRTADYYAGDEYVDLTGIDAYTDFVDLQHIRGVAEVIRLGKPFGFTEFGPHGSKDPPGDYDYTRFIDGIMKNFPETVFFMPWNAKWSLARNNNTRELLNHSWVLNRDDLPRDLTRVASP